MSKIVIGIREQLIRIDPEELPSALEAQVVKYEIIGKSCDDKELGDNCNTDCNYYRTGTCPSRLMRDTSGRLWSVVPVELKP